MKYNYKKVPDEKIYSELKRRSEEQINQMEKSGFPEQAIEQFKFEVEHKLDYPHDITNEIFIKVMEAIFERSNQIHVDIIFEMISGITAIDIKSICQNDMDNQTFMRLLSEAIMNIIIKKMEALYYFDKDDVFAGLVSQLCNILDLDTSYYGFSKVGTSDPK